MCKIPLASLATGCSLHERFPIRAMDSQSHSVGELEVRIDIVDTETAQGE